VPGSYCNAVQIFFSPWEFNFELAHLAPEVRIEPMEPSGQAPEPAVEVHKHIVAKVVMSPQHTKALLKVLRDNVANYEGQFGEIPDVAPQEGGERR
jgi:Protein of unknown function (DUF3467)